ncbi:uncharacterized protein LOC119111463 [Pollicipes pollicipes]|uniref:uncharacterized protein LOC119111463 n=1 Tax=Pollicipes pollicipes TaxID=41117 RepID=UPI001884E4D8|nr:uncharacterized protein LOC119111463 [Pollicipes pollicipes]
MASLAVLGGLMSAGPGSPPPPDDDEEGDQASRGYPDSSASRSEDGYLDGSGSEKRLSCETLLSGAKKRRKQSHPVKIGPGGEAEPEVPPPGEAELPPPLRCPYCPQAFPHQVQFKYHIEVEHVRRALADDAPAESVIFGRELPLNLSSGPRHDGLRGQESKHQAENYRSEHSLPPAMPLPPSFQDKFPAPEFLQYGPPPFLLSFLSQQAGAAPPTPTPGESPLKIFNPEAYCELCNKEFCNKYFLKTHKANKHGVYSEPASGGAGGGGPAPAGVGGPPPPPPPLPPPPGAHHSPSADSRDSGRPSSEAEAVRPAGAAHPDAFCELCQKEFCDAYYLRRHKQRVHSVEGREPPPPPPRPPPGAPPEAGAAGQGAADPYDAQQLLEPVVSPTLLQQLNTGETHDHQKVIHELMERLATNGESPKNFTKEQLREIGVVNVDAFCNVCWKEFCNKYFLKVHKYRKHAIGSPPPEMDRHNGASGGHDSMACPPLEKLLDAPLKENSEPKECDLCQRTFQSSYLVQMHRYYFHGSGHPNSHGSMPPTLPGNAPAKNSPSADHKKKAHFSDDLQKLQGMIKGLNDKKGGHAAVACHVCGKNVDRQALQTHLMNEHGVFHNQEELIIPKPPTSLSSSKPQSNKDSREASSPPPQGSETVCSVCKKDFYAKFFLQQHMQAAHGIQASPMNETAFLARIRLEVEGQKKLERPKPASTSRSYCEICNKELCNKYFMKTHMIKMHGINMENHQIQGGVKCDVCQKELCSKYFLKVHKQNTHGIYDPEDDKALKASDAVIKDEEGLEVCTVCSGKFKTAKLLESHMASEHGAPKEKKPKSSSVPRSAPGIGVTCSLCGRCFPDLLSLRLHAMQAHPLPEQKGENNGTAGEETPLEPAQLGEKLLRHPFGPFAGPFPPFLPPERVMSLLPHQPPALAAKHASAAAGGRRYRCKPCRLSFPQRHRYLSHWHQKHGHSRLPYAASLLRGYLNRNYRCTRCGFSSRMRSLGASGKDRTAPDATAGVGDRQLTMVAAERQCEGIESTECDRKPELFTECNREPELLTECGREPELLTECDRETELLTECDREPELFTECDREPELFTVCDREPDLLTECGRESELLTECGREPELLTECDREPELFTVCDREPELFTECGRESELLTE